MRGPMVYCIEECDNPLSYDNARIDMNQKFFISNGAGLLNKYITLKTGNNANELTFIPYFAWDNRQSGKMKVWIDLKRE